MNLGPAALAFAKVFNARQQGQMAGTQRAREQQLAAEQDAAEMERAKLDLYIKQQMADKNRLEMEQQQRENSPEWIAEAQRRQQEMIRYKAQVDAEFSPRQQPTTPEREFDLSRARAAGARAGAPPMGHAATPRSEIPSDSERKAAYFLPNLEEAVREIKKFKPPTLAERVKARIPGVGNATVSTNAQVARNYADVIKEAHLRMTSGATITPDEEAIVERAYIPLSTDDPATVEAKFRRLDNLLAQTQAQAARAIPHGTPGVVRQGGPQPLSQADKLKAKSDPAFASWLVNKGYREEEWR